MTVSDLRNTMMEIKMDEESKQRMIRELSGVQKTYRRDGVLKTAAVAAIALMAVGALSIPAGAFWGSFVRERMENVPEETIQTTLLQLDEQTEEADRFSRDYTVLEKERMNVLWSEYRQGTFPEGVLLQTAGEAGDADFYFQTAENKFYLPSDRELTDEEILQIIDFNELRNYALIERAAEERDAVAAQIAARGGVSKQDALMIAGGFLQSIYGISPDTVEGKIFFNEALPEASSIWDAAYYNVHYEGKHGETYLFSIRAEDGRLLQAMPARMGKQADAEIPGVTDAAEKAVSIKAKAEDFIKNKVGITGPYEQVEACYYVYNGQEVSDTVTVTVLKAEGEAYAITYTWDEEIKKCVMMEKAVCESMTEHQPEIEAERAANERGGDVVVEVIRK